MQARRRQRGARARRRALALVGALLAAVAVRPILMHRHTGPAMARTAGVVNASPAPGAPAPPSLAVTGSDADAAPASAVPEVAAGDAATDEAPSADAPDWAPSVTNARFPIAREATTFTDPTRPTPARGDVPGSDGRTLRTLLLRPVGVSGPLPLVVFAHGYDSEPEVYERLLDAWAGAGYLVAAPEMPGSARDLPGEPTEDDIGQQARDVSFLITALLDGRFGVDPGEIAVAGHSDGGSTVATLALDDDFGDSRIGAYLVLSGGVDEDIGGSWGTSVVSGPMLVTVGENDEYGDLPDAWDVYNLAGMPKGILTVPGGDHLGLYIGSSMTDERMRATTVGFLDGVLRRDPDALQSLHLTRESGLVRS